MNITHACLVVLLTVCLSACKADLTQQCHVVEADTGGGGSGGASTSSSGGDGGIGGVPILCPPSECPIDGTPGAQKKACDDVDPDTVDRCFAVGSCGGFCANIPGQCDHFDDVATQQSRCDDFNACSADRCDDSNTCINEPLPNGTLCGSGTCQEGVCVFG